MPFAHGFVPIQIRREARKKLKSLAVQRDRPMYQVIEDLLDALECKQDMHSHAGLVVLESDSADTHR